MFIDPVTSFLLTAGLLGWLISILIDMYKIAKSPPDLKPRMQRIYRDMSPGPKDFMHYHEVYNALIHGVGTTGSAELRHNKAVSFKELYMKKEANADWIYAGTVADDDEAQRAIEDFLLYDRN